MKKRAGKVKDATVVSHKMILVNEVTGLRELTKQSKRWYMYVRKLARMHDCQFFNEKIELKYCG